jgi:hypothetical protein
LIALAVACGKGAPSKLEQELRAARTACDKGEATQCFVAASALDPTKKDELRRAMDLWSRGCELGHGASCAQLGTVAEFGMVSGGARPDPSGAIRYYARACERGDAESCKRAGRPLPEGVTDPSVKAFPWREALTPICGKGRGELGPLFDGLVLGEPMTEAMQQQVAAFEKKFKARVHYYPGDPPSPSRWLLDVWFQEKTGIEKVLVAGWGTPDLRAGAWTSDTTHVIAWWMHNERESGVSWSPYRSVAEVIRPDDKELLGFEPGFAIVGSKLADLQSAMGQRLLRWSANEYRWHEVAPTAGFEAYVTEKRGVIVELRTQNWITNSPEIGAQLHAALEQKWGAPKIGKDGTHTWLLKGRRVVASKPASGNFELVITRR